MSKETVNDLQAALELAGIKGHIQGMGLRITELDKTYQAGFEQLNRRISNLIERLEIDRRITALEKMVEEKKAAEVNAARAIESQSNS